MREGQRYSRLVALKQAKRAKSGNEQWIFKCDCGKSVVARTIDVKRGLKQSCGCLRKFTAPRITTHGMFGTPEYETWAQMIQRCTNPLHFAWKRYGDRG